MRFLPVNDVAGLIAAIRARPGALNYASGGVGFSSATPERSPET